MRMKLTSLQRCSLLAWLVGGIPLTQAQLAPPAPTPIIGARMPSLSPDGQRLAFVYRGDIWVASAEGGRATPITQHLETDAYPVFSPDGQWIAFASKRTGNWDIFLVPAEGGSAQQITFHAGSDIAASWSPDSQRLFFSSKRDTANYSLYSVELANLRTRRLAEDYSPIISPACSPDGQTIAYGRYGFSWTRPRYVGSAASQIWLCTVTNSALRPLTDDNRQHLWTRWMPDGRHLLTVTIGETTPSVSKIGETLPPLVDNPRRTPNLWLYDLSSQAEPLTTFVGGAVRCPCVAAKSGDIAFEYGPDLWLMRDPHKEPQKIKLLAATDDKQNPRRREKLTSGVTEAELSADGKTVAFGLRGDIWTIAVEKPKGVEGRSAELARRLTDWVGDDSDFSWSPDHKKLYFTSDRESYVRLFEMDVETREVKSLWRNECDVTGVTLSPDGKQLSFWASGREGGLYLLKLEDGSWRKLVPLPGPHWHGQGGLGFAWSPDGKWMAYCRRDGSQAWNIFLIPTAGGDAHNITRLFANHTMPAWSPDGKYLFFQSNRDGDGLYVVPLTREQVRTVDTDLKFEKTTNAVTVTIDFEDIDKRIRKHSTQNPQADLYVAADGQIVFASEGDIWSVSYDGKETKRITTGGGKSNFRVGSDGKRGSFIQNGDLHTFNVADKKDEKVTFTADWERDVRAERQAAFAEFWRSIERGFYDANFHARDWVGLRKRYEPLLPAVETHDEFATLLQMLIGELECSHCELTPASTPPSPVTPHLGFTFDYAYGGPGLKVARVPRGAPGSYRKTEIKAGEIVLAINGKEVALDEKLYDLINDQQDREFEFLVNTNADKKTARKVKYKVMTLEEWNDLDYKNRLDRRRQRTEEKSKGRIGYLHIASMGPHNQLQFEREAYEALAGRDGLIIDVRFNTGGNIADTLIEWLSRKPHGYTRPRDGEPEVTPFHAVDRRMIVLMNEHSYSNSEIFPYEMRARGLARLVGMPTPGYVIWISPFRLLDGTGARLPLAGAYRLDGTCMENLGEPPDVIVRLSPEDWVADRDPQLDKAIELLTEELGARKN